MPTNEKGAHKQEDNLLFLYSMLFKDLWGTFVYLLILFYKMNVETWQITLNFHSNTCIVFRTKATCKVIYPCMLNYPGHLKAGKQSLWSLKCCKAEHAFSQGPCSDRSAHHHSYLYRW